MNDKKGRRLVFGRKGFSAFLCVRFVRMSSENQSRSNDNCFLCEATCEQCKKKENDQPTTSKTVFLECVLFGNQFQIVMPPRWLLRSLIVKATIWGLSIPPKESPPNTSAHGLCFDRCTHMLATYHGRTSTKAAGFMDCGNCAKSTKQVLNIEGRALVVARYAQSGMLNK